MPRREAAAAAVVDADRKNAGQWIVDADHGDPDPLELLLATRADAHAAEDQPVARTFVRDLVEETVFAVAVLDVVDEEIDVRRGDVIWTARFDETQKPLSENIFALWDISQRGIRWLSAEQLTQEGVKKAVGELYQILVRNPASS